MTKTDLDIRTKDAKKLRITVYSPEKNNGKVIIVATMGGLTKEHYDPLASFFQQQNYSVITFDYRGTGASAPEKLKGYQASMHQWAVQDIDAVILYVKNNYLKQEIIYIGHCIGAEIVGLAQASQYIGKLVMVNSALSCKKLWSLKNRFRIRTMKITVGILNKIFGYFPGKLFGYSGNLPKGVMYEWANWCNKSNGLFDMFPDTNYRKLRIPLLAFSFSDDWHSQPKAVRELLNRFSNAIITWHHLKPREIGLKKIGRSGFFDPMLKATLWIKMLRWMNEEENKEKQVKKINN